MIASAPVVAGISSDREDASERRIKRNDRSLRGGSADYDRRAPDQNDIMKVLTIVSVVTVPPMILAGIWGMNFKSIPEYNWAHGYAFGPIMIVLSMALPLTWFKLRKWL